MTVDRCTGERSEGIVIDDSSRYDLSHCLTTVWYVPRMRPASAPRASPRRRVEGWRRGTTARKDTGMSEQSTAAAAGTIDVGGDLTVNRLGFGAMRITGQGVWGDPPDHDQAIATLRRAVDLAAHFIHTD